MLVTPEQKKVKNSQKLSVNRVEHILKDYVAAGVTRPSPLFFPPPYHQRHFRVISRSGGIFPGNLSVTRGIMAKPGN